MIKCKRCFKSYDGLDPECPRCGKINEQDDLSMGLTEEKKKFTFSQFKCSFCGKILLNNQTNCSACMSSSYVNKKKNPTLISPRRLDEIIYEIFRTSHGKVDMLDIFKKLELLNFDIDNWQAPFAYEYGTKVTTKKALFTVITSFSISLVSIFFRRGEWSDSIGLFLVLIMTAAISFMFKRKSLAEGVSISKLSSHDEASITNFTRNKKNVPKDIFKLWSFDLKSVCLIYKDEFLYAINFVDFVDGKKRNHRVDTLAFDKSMEFLRLILLFCLKYNIDLYTEVLSKESNIENIS